MNTNKHGLKGATRRNALAISSAVLFEPKLSNSEKAKIERAWKIEIRRRMAEMRAGKVKCVSGEQALRNAYRALDEKEQKPKRSNKPLINTGLQPGVGGRRVTSAVLTASRVRGKAVKTAGCSLVRRVTGLKPGANERRNA